MLPPYIIFLSALLGAYQSVQKLGGAVVPPALGHFVPAGAWPVKLISFYHWRQEMGSPSPLHIPVPALGVGLLLSAAGHVKGVAFPY